MRGLEAQEGFALPCSQSEAGDGMGNLRESGPGFGWKRCVFGNASSLHSAFLPAALKSLPELFPVNPIAYQEVAVKLGTILIEHSILKCKEKQGGKYDISSPF